MNWSGKEYVIPSVSTHAIVCTNCLSTYAINFPQYVVMRQICDQASQRRTHICGQENTAHYGVEIPAKKAPGLFYFFTFLLLQWTMYLICENSFPFKASTDFLQSVSKSLFLKACCKPIGQGKWFSLHLRNGQNDGFSSVNIDINLINSHIYSRFKKGVPRF